MTRPLYTPLHIGPEYSLHFGSDDSLRFGADDMYRNRIYSPRPTRDVPVSIFDIEHGPYFRAGLENNVYRHLRYPWPSYVDRWHIPYSTLKTEERFLTDTLGHRSRDLLRHSGIAPSSLYYTSRHYYDPLLTGRRGHLYEYIDEGVAPQLQRQADQWLNESLKQRSLALLSSTGSYRVRK